MKTLFASILGLLALVTLSGCAALPTAGEPVVQQLVSEDDQVRITELRVRGQTQRISVANKDSAAPRYEINPTPGGSDPSAARTSAGQRVWTLFSF